MKNNFQEFIKAAAHVKPSENQLRMLRETPFYAFIHFSPNTYTNLEWGLVNEDPAIFNPTELDCDQWCEAIKSAGMKGAVITAKHHDGFCLWPSKYTEHSIKNSPYKNGRGDIIGEFADACRRHGLKFGFYLSPWDRNSKYYGTPEYNDYYKKQLTELLTGYGEVFHIWFDGACGEGPNGKKQEYDYEGYIELIRKYQPKATIFNDFGPDIRWCGNESGSARYAEWAVVPSELCYRCKNVQTGAGPLEGDLSHMYNSDSDIGFLSNIIYSKGLVFCPSEIDMSIRPGWFYHENEEPHSLERLFNTYLNSVGANTTFNLNIPPMPNGRFNDKDAARLHELGELIRSSFADEISARAEITSEYIGDGQLRVTFRFANPEKISYVVLKERISEGQRVETFQLRRQNGDKEDTIYRGSCIGSNKICRLGVTTDNLILHITSARDKVELEEIEIFA